MTRPANARLAGIAYFVYLAAGMSAMATAGRTVAPLLAVFESLSALVLGVTLYALTRDEDPDIALLAMLCRVIEAIPGEGFVYFSVGNLLFCWLLLRGRLIPAALAWLGVAGSIVLVVQLLAQRAAGGATNWSSPVTWIGALPTLVFELAFAVWLLTRGVAARSRVNAGS